MDQDSIDFTSILDGGPIALDYTPSDDEAALYGHFERRLEDARGHRYAFSRNWLFNKLYLEGEQLLYRDQDTHEFIRVRSTEHKRLYSVNNQLQPTARALHGKLCRMKPYFNAIPATTEQDEMHGAMVADAYMRYFDRKQRMELKYSDAMKYLLYSGTACIELAWNPLGGRRLAACPSEECTYFDEDLDMVDAPCPTCMEMAARTADMNTQAVMQAAEMPLEFVGDVPEPEPINLETDVPKLVLVNEGCEEALVHEIEEVYVDPMATGPDDAQFYILAQTMALSKLRSMFPERAPYIRAEQDIPMDDSASRSYNYDTGDWDSTSIDDHAVLYKYFEAPTALFPGGRVIWFANGMVLEEKEADFDYYARIPLFFQYWWKMPGRFWGQCFIDQAASRQKELNELETQQREHLELISRSKLLVPLGSGVSVDEVSATTAQVITYNPTVGAPEYMVPPEMPMSTQVRQSQLVNDIAKQAGLTASEASMAEVAPGAGRGLAIAAAEGDQQLDGIQKYNREEMRDFYRCLLLMIKKYRRPDWKFAVAGDKGPEVYSIEDLNLREGWDLELEADDGFSNNKAMRLQEAMNIAGLGVINDPATGMPDIQRFAKLARLKIPGIGPDIKSTEYSAAAANLKRLEKGQDVMPAVEDDPDVFSEVYLHWLRTKGRAGDPELTNVVRNLYMYYQQQIMAAEMAKMEMEQGPAGMDAGSTSALSQSAPGGTPNQNIVAEGPPDAAAEGEALVEQANAAAEGAAQAADTGQGT